ncbi:restriction endonuclease [Streptomyces sp. NPDC058632]|uniref:restriction endonuclease n=1 Tax=Streptomyces sp. NPDC058632 TaxID=3346567 RepID=UPI0036601804
MRVYLLGMEYLARTQPVDNPAPTEPVSLEHRIGQRITHILGRPVVPMFNALIATCGEHRREPFELREDIENVENVENVERRLCRHHKRLATLEGAAPAENVGPTLKTMTWQAFEQHVADLLRRDGCTGVVVRQPAATGASTSPAASRTGGPWPSSARENRSGRWTVPSADLQKFAGAVRAINRVDLVLFVATCDFSHTSQAIADLTGVVTVNREEVEAWTAGVRLKALR